MQHALECSGVELRIGFKPLLRGVDLRLDPGSSTALVGPNGTGKTSLLRVLAGVSRPYAGRVSVFGEEVWPRRFCTKEHNAVYLASSPALLLDHSVNANLEFFCNCFGINPTWQVLNGAVARVGLEGRGAQPSRTLSTGQKRRLTLAALLMIRPRLLLTDEPTNGLDGEGIDLCLNVFEELRAAQGTAVLAASHDLALVNHCQRRVEIATYYPRMSEHPVQIRKLT